jgi:hypothetical protein
MIAGYMHQQSQDTVQTFQVNDTASLRSLPQNLNTSYSEDDFRGYFPTGVDMGLDTRPALKIKESNALQDQDIQEGVFPYPASAWNSAQNFFFENPLKEQVIAGDTSKSIQDSVKPSISVQSIRLVPEIRNKGTFDWVLALFILVALLLVWIRLFYGRFFATLATALTSFQISSKLFRERNVLQQRVSRVLDFIYILVIAICIFESVVHFGVIQSNLTHFNQFLLWLNIIIFYSLGRYLILRLTGYVFLVQSIIQEFIHNNYLINRGTGLVLFPLLVMAHYFPSPLVKPLLIVGMGLILSAFFYKALRGYQIIIRNDVILFYLILYLCTLEILPLLLGYKVVTSLI